jgi:hypothetical protein
MLVLAPVVCVLAGIASAEILRKASKSVRIYLTKGYEQSEASIIDNSGKKNTDNKATTES